MKNIVIRALARLLPGGVLLVAATIVLSLAAFRDRLPALLPVYFYVVFGVGILLAWRFDRSRLVLALLILALADRALLYGTPSVSRAVALLLPLDLAALSWLSERGLLTPRGQVKLMVLLLQALAVALLARPELSAAAAWLDYTLVESAWLRVPGLPQMAVLAFGLASALVALRFVRHPTALESGSVWALVAAFLALLARPAGPARTIYFTTAALILVVSLVETSHRMAYGDELTGLPGRRALNEALLKLRGHYAIAMVDIDHFKRFNDEHGHDVGDQLLRMVGGRLAGVGGGGKAYRYGGEEFAVLFPGKSIEETVPYLEALRVGISVSAFTVRGRRRPRGKPEKPRASAGRKKVSVTISIGVAEAGRQHSTPERVVEAADAALYRAKKAGRNRLAN
jgi:diguanylate cyclase (GGDEF)-like protein